MPGTMPDSGGPGIIGTDMVQERLFRQQGIQAVHFFDRMAGGRLAVRFDFNQPVQATQQVVFLAIIQAIVQGGSVAHYFFSHHIKPVSTVHELILLFPFKLTGIGRVHKYFLKFSGGKTSFDSASNFEPDLYLLQFEQH